MDADASNDKGTGLVNGFSYPFVRTFKEYSRWADDVDEDEEEMLETHNEVLEATDGAVSLACSGRLTLTRLPLSTNSCSSAMALRANMKIMSS